MIFGGFGKVLGWFGDGFWEVFSRTFSDDIEKRDFAKISVSPRWEPDFYGFEFLKTVKNGYKIAANLE